jgi:hypothetical protein
MAAPANNRRITIILIVGGVFVALLAAVNLMGGGGGGGEAGDDSTITPAATAAGGALATPPTTAPAPAPSLPNEQFDAFATRNPFEPAIQVTEDIDTGTEPIDSGTDPGTATPPPDTAPPRASSPDPTTGTVVALIDVFDEGGITMARIQVGSTVYTVAAGQTFATSYKVVSLSGTCGQFLYGDSPFTLCENEQVIK